MKQESTDRNTLQDEMADYLVNKGSLLLLWGTSVGKSYVAIKAFYRYMEKSFYPRFLLLVAETAHKENWKREFIKCLGEEKANTVLSHVTIECYASLKNYADTEWDAVCLDECHHIFSDARFDILTSIKTERFLGLSATVKRDMIDSLKSLYPDIKVHRITTQEAIDKGYIPKPQVICIPLELDPYRNIETIELNYRTSKSRNMGTIKDVWSNRWTYMKNRKRYEGYVIELKCTQKEKYDYINEQFDYWKKQFLRQSDNIRLKNMWLQWGSKRKRFLGELKTQEAFKLCSRLTKEKTRFICFCTSVLQAEVLGGKNCIHSQIKNPQAVINRFNEGKTDSIYAVGMLVEGVSLANIQAGIIVQLDGEERQFIQKSGRIYRAKRPVQYILYYKNTRDEEYLQKALEGINDDYIIYKQ